MKTIVSEFKISYAPRIKASERATVRSSTDAVRYLRDIWGGEMNYRERFYILMLNRANKIVGFSLISVGGTSGTIADGKIIFQHALLSNAHALILAHNHPSGQLSPSDNDKALTRKMVEFGKYIDMHVLDHVILTEEGYYSFADDGEI